ncbi:MAG: nitrate reductase molybdenum cofactor assembly chaperone [Alphaproteobacteria bacterium]|nr:MAG: nitrate reductase molybdenum cofactor assembly chaperone [Alphaproteobacteria bacterium]
MRTLKILGILLSYPSVEQVKALPECLALLRKETWLPQTSVAALEELAGWMQGQDIMDLQEAYVDLFDRTPSLSLHLFEHVHGDSRDRGPALVDLHNLYQEAGLMISVHEMPDYLPLFLEYLSVLQPAQAAHDLSGAIDVIAAIGARLKNRKTPYAAVFDALEEAAEHKPDDKAIAAALAEDAGAPLDNQQLDREWTEQFAFENAAQTNPDGGCPAAEDMVKRMKDSVNQTGAGSQ